MSGAMEIWIDRRRDELTAFCNRWGTFPVAITSMGDLQKPLPSDITGGTWLPLPGIGMENAAAFRNANYTSLWVNPRHRKYRDCFKVYLEAIWGMDSSLLGEAYDVDHVYNKERANNFGYAYVMVFPVLGSANSSHGSGYEKAMTAASMGMNAKVMRSIDTVSLLKLHNALSPRVGGAFTPQQRTAIQAVADALHIPVSEVEQEIDNMMLRAYA